MKFSTFDADGQLLKKSRYLSMDGGYVVTIGTANEALQTEYQKVPYPFAFENKNLAGRVGFRWPL